MPSNNPPVASNPENIPSASPRPVLGRQPAPQPQDSFSTPPQPVNPGGQQSPQPQGLPSASPQAPENGPPPVAVSSPVTTPIKIGTLTPTVVVLPSASGYVIQGTTLSKGSPAITIEGVIISADSSGIKTFGFGTPEAAAIASIVGASPLPNPTEPMITPAPTPQGIPGGSVVIGGQTLTPGGNVAC